jgi:anaerobic selenocysteine-containing dehydrogenase
VGFNTVTGRIELWSNFLNNAGLDPLPYFEEPAPGPKATPELVEEYPYVLTTGARTWSSFHSEHRQIPRLRAIHPNPTIEINPKTCVALGISDGDWVWVENIKGRAKRRVKATPIWEERIVSCDHGWWLPEAERENLFDVFDVAINNLVPWGQQGKSGFGANYKTTLVKIYKVKDGE